MRYFFSVAFLFLAACSSGVRPDIVRNQKAQAVTLSGDGTFIFEDLYSQAIHLANEGFLDLAIQKLKEILKRGGRDPFLYRTLLSFELEELRQVDMSMKKNQQKVREILETANEALRLYPDEVKIRTFQVELLRISGRYKDFYRALKNLLKKRPKNVFANYYLGAYYFINQKQAESKLYFLKVLANADPRDREQDLYLFQSYYYLGMANLFDGSFDNAVRFFKKALKFRPDDVEILQYLALSYRAKLDFKESVSVFRKIPPLYLTPEFLEEMAGPFLFVSEPFEEEVKSLENRSTFIRAFLQYRRKEFDLALKTVRKWFKERKNPDFYSFYLRYLIVKENHLQKEKVQLAFVLGRKAKEMGHYELAVRFLKEVEESKMAEPDIYWLIGSIYDDAGEREKAIDYYHQYLSDPKGKEYATIARLRISFLLSQSGRLKEAFEELEQAKKAAIKKEDRFKSYFYSGLIYAQANQSDQALKDYQMALSYEPENADVLYFIASLRVQRGELKKAEEILNLLLKKYPNSARNQNLLAYVYALSATHLDRALELIDLALTSEPKSIEYLDTRGWIYFQSGDYQNALKTFRQIEEMISDSTSHNDLKEIFEHLAALYDRLGLKSRAEYYRKKAKS